MQFDLLFAGTSFISDKAHQMRREPEGPDLPPLERFRPNQDMLDEINRLIPFQHLQDITPSDDAQTHTLDALGLPTRLSMDLTKVRIGDFYYPNTASRFAFFRGLATSSQIKAMLAATVGNKPATFIMQAVPIGSATATYTVSTPMYMLPPRTLGETFGTPQMDGLFLVELVDDRFYARGTPLTLRPTPSSTWAGLLAQAATALGISLTIPAISATYGQPEPDSQLWSNTENAAFLLDSIAWNIGCVVVRNLDGSYQLMTPVQSQAVVNSNRPKTRLAGGDIFASGNPLFAGDLNAARNAVCPATVNVTFPKFITADPVPHFLNPRYASGRPSAWFEDSYGDVYNVAVPIASGGPLVSGIAGVSQETIKDTAKALYSGEAFSASGMSPLNSSGLTALAMQMAQTRYNGLVGLDEVYVGTLAWTPEGIHDLLWTYSPRERLASTRVMRGPWNYTPTDGQHSFSGNTGVAGHVVAQTWRDNASGAAYGVNLATVGSGLTLIPGVQTSGGISEAIIMAANTVASGGPASLYYSGGVNSGYYTDYQLQTDASVVRLFASGPVYFRSFAFPLTISGSPTGREFEVVNAAPLPGPGQAPSTLLYFHEDPAGTASMRFNTPDGLPVVQQPQEAMRWKYSDGRWRPGELRPIQPFTNTLGGGGANPGPLMLSPGSVIPLPTKWQTASGPLPGLGMATPSAGYVNIGMTESKPTSGTTGPIPHLEYVTESGIAGAFIQSPYIGMVQFVNSTYTSGPSAGLNPISGLSLPDGLPVLFTNRISGNETGPWVTHSGPWERPNWFLSGQPFAGSVHVYSVVDDNFYRGDWSVVGIDLPGRVGTDSPSWSLFNLPVVQAGAGITVGGAGFRNYVVSLAGASSGGIGSGYLTSGAVQIIGQSGIIATQTAPNVWTVGANLSGAIGSGAIASGALGSGYYIPYPVITSGIVVPAPGYGGGGSSAVQWYTTQMDYTLFQAAATTVTVPINAMPAKGVLMSFYVFTSQAWATSVGSVNPPAFGFSAAADQSDSPGSYGALSSTAITAFPQVFGGSMPTHTGGWNFTMTMQGSANLSNLTAGHCIIYYCYGAPP